MMSKYKYVYKNPLDEGYKKFKLTKKQHNQLFKHRQIMWFDKYEYYINEHEVLLHKFYNWKVIILNTIFFPIVVLLNGIVNFKECCIEMKKLYNQKKYGYFISDYIYSGTETYEQIKNLIQ